MDHRVIYSLRYGRIISGPKCEERVKILKKAWHERVQIGKFKNFYGAQFNPLNVYIISNVKLTSHCQNL